MSEEIILPEGYTRVQYLYFDGNSYIRTGVFATNQTGAKIKWSRDKAYGSGHDSYGSYLLSCRSLKGGVGGTNDTWLITQHSHNGTYWAASFGKSYKDDIVTNIPLVLGATYETSLNYLNSETITINNETVVSNIDRSIFTEDKYCINSLVLGSFVSDELNPYNAYNHLGRIYYCKISEGTELIRDFVPCLDNVGVPCMYDLVGGETYYNQGTGKFDYMPYPYENEENYELPAGYTKCLYLQSDGTQYINTSIYKDFEGNDAISTEDGIIPTNETGLYIKAQRLNYGDYAPFGCRGATYGIYPPRINTRDKTIEYRWNVYKQPFSYDKGDDLIYSSSINLYNDRTIHFNSEDTDWYGYITETLSTIGVPVGLFSWNTNGSFNSPWGGRIYRAKITQGTELIRDFVPCLDASGIPCMYDLVNGYSYYNQGSGSNFEYCIDHQLPSDFIKLKYLEATGTQYINTGYVPQTTDNGDGTYTATTGLYIDTQNITVSDSLPMGCQTTSSTGTRFFTHRLHSASYNPGYGWGTWKQVTTTKGKVAYQSKLNYLNDKKAVLESPIFSTITNNLGNLSFQPTLPIYMFGVNQANKLAYNWKGRIYRAKISEGTEIVRDFVPAYDQRLLRPCMYDIINNVAYYNDGTGEFEYNRDFEGSYTGFAQLGGVGNRIGGTGADGSEYISFELPSGYTRIAYLENASIIQSGEYGACLIDTGLHVSNDTRVEVTGTPLEKHWMDCFCGYAESMIFYNPNENPPKFSYKYGVTNYYTYVYTSFGQKYNIVADGRDFYMDGKKLESFRSYDGVWHSYNEIPEQEPFETETYYLFMRSPRYGCGKSRIYDFNVRNGDIQEADYVPVVDTAGVPCMYDKVSKTPKYAPSKSAFIAGIETLAQLYALLAKLPDLTGQTQGTLTIRLDASLQTDELRAMIDEKAAAKNWEIPEAPELEL